MTKAEFLEKFRDVLVKRVPSADFDLEVQRLSDRMKSDIHVADLRIRSRLQGRPECDGLVDMMWGCDS
jgi:hypothetical protein